MALQWPPASMDTRFASAARSSEQELQDQVTTCLDLPVVNLILEAVDSFALVLNEHRQVLALNAAIRRALAIEEASFFKGLRPGELFHCVHAGEGPDGCGTAEACARCGAVLTVLAALARDQQADGECLLGMRHEGQWVSREFQVRATPLSMGGQRFLVVVLRDISDQKRREVLERIFLHDLLNTLQGLQGWVELMQVSRAKTEVAAQHIMDLADHLTQDVVNQRLMLQAERGELSAMLVDLPVSKFIDELRGSIERHPALRGRALAIQPIPEDLWLMSDPRLVHRILLNMVINALEASPLGCEVGLSAAAEGRGCRFTVHNEGRIPEEFASRIFQRSFSSKGSHGRGLGTYSMKLLGENVLGGKVGFTSTEADGTAFYLMLPREGWSAHQAKVARP